MFGRLMPKEGRFFDYFNDHASLVVEGAHELNAFLSDMSNREAHAQNVAFIEKKADKITHETINLLHQTFITPLDREDIHKLISNMDDILDMMEDVAECVMLYDVREVTDAARRLADICVSCAEKVKQAVSMLSNMDNSAAILKICSEIDQLESEADRVMRSAMATDRTVPTPEPPTRLGYGVVTLVAKSTVAAMTRSLSKSMVTTW